MHATQVIVCSRHEQRASVSSRDGLIHRLHRRADGWLQRDSVALPPVQRSWVARAVLIAGVAA